MLHFLMQHYFDIPPFDVALLNFECSILLYDTSCCYAIAVGTVFVSLFNVALFQYCSIKCCIVLMLHYFNFPQVFAALFNAALFHYFTI